MFWFDKDMERVMLAKKKEVLQEIETAKKRVLHELYCLKRSVHTDMCEMIADYNRMNLALNKTIENVRSELKCITDEYRNLIADTFNQYSTTIDNKLLALETFEEEVIKEVNDKLSELDTMKAQVEALIAEMEQIVADGVTEADLTALKEELLVAMESAGAQADWNENDETSAAFVKNRTHYRDGTTTVDSFNGVNTSYISGSTSTLVFPVGNARKVKFKAKNDTYEFYLNERVTGLASLYGDYGIVMDTWYCAGDYTVADGAIGVVYQGMAAFSNDDITVVMVGNTKYQDNGTPIEVEITHGSGGYKTIDPLYIVEEANVGALLALVNGKIVTIDSPFAVATELQYVALYDGLIPYKESDTTYAIFETTVEAGQVMGQADKYNYIWASHKNGSSFHYNKINNIYFNFEYAVSSGKITFKIPLDRIVDENYETNGAYLKVVYPTNVNKSSRCILTSPNGSLFNVVVSDDGTLSATPVTE